MRFPFRIAFDACLILALLMLAGYATAQPPSSATSLAETLHAGGNVIYMRHTTADVGNDIQGAGEWWKKCGEGHRMLSDQGRANALLVGEAIRRAGIPISGVLCSEYCRAVETARLLALGEPKTDARLNGWPAWKAVDPEHGLERLAQGMRALLASKPARGNVLLVSHRQEIPNLPDPVIGDLKDGESAVFTPDGGGGFVLRGRIKVEDWPALK